MRSTAQELKIVRFSLTRYETGKWRQYYVVSKKNKKNLPEFSFNLLYCLRAPEAWIAVLKIEMFLKVHALPLFKWWSHNSFDRVIMK